MEEGSKESFTLLARYNRGVNEKLEGLIKTLSPEEWDRNLGGYFPSVHSLCNHLVAGDYIWLRRIRPCFAFKSLSPAYFSREISFQEEKVLESPADYLARRPELDGIITDMVGEIRREDLSKTVSFTNVRGLRFERRLEVILIHLFNHQTYHRGMLSLYLELLGRENDYSSLYPYAPA
jgi:uncharacterized damage-inducible protein DinB